MVLICVLEALQLMKHVSRYIVSDHSLKCILHNYMEMALIVGLVAFFIMINGSDLQTGVIL